MKKEETMILDCRHGCKSSNIKITRICNSLLIIEVVSNFCIFCSHLSMFLHPRKESDDRLTKISHIHVLHMWTVLYLALIVVRELYPLIIISN